MPLIYLVRHGEANASWDQHRDPPLSALGAVQAQAAAETLIEHTGIEPCRIISSPLQRAQQTAAPYAQHREQLVEVEPLVREIPSPEKDLAQRRQWLMQTMHKRLGETEMLVQNWRRALLERLINTPADLVVFTHFMVINAAVGAATADDHLMIFRPANCSITVVVSDGRHLRLEALGAEAESLINT